MEQINNVENINNQIQNLKMERRKAKEIEDKRQRLRSNNGGSSNTLQRMSVNFKNKIDYINLKRMENGLDSLSGPKITELIIKHIKCWKNIEKDIIHYNTALDNDDEEEVEFNE